MCSLNKIPLKQLSIFIIFLFGQIVISQTTVNVDADDIVVANDELYFLKKNGGQISSITVLSLFATDDFLGKEIKTQNVEVSEYYLDMFNTISQNPNKYSFTIKVSDLEKQKKKLSIEELFAENLYERTEHNGGSVVKGITYYNQSFLKKTDCYFKTHPSKGKQEWRCSDDTLIPFVIVDLGKNRNIIIFPFIQNNFTYKKRATFNDIRFSYIQYQGYIIPDKKGLKAKYQDTFLAKDTSFNFLQKIESFEDKSHIWSSNFAFNNSYVKDAIFGQILIEKKFDTVISQNGFIVGRNNEEVNIYNLQLLDITPKNLRSAFPIFNNSDYSMCLIDNQIKYVLKNGTIINELPKKEPVAICGFNSSLGYSYLSIKKDSTDFNLHINHKYLDFDEEWKETNYSTNLFSGSEYQSVNFLDYTILKNKQVPKELTFHRYYEWYGFKEYIVIEKDNKFGLLSLISKKTNPNEDSQAYPNIELIELLPAEFDTIKLVLRTPHILFSKNGLQGLYGLNASPQYKNLDVGEYFSRFQLPNGQEGWLDKLGNEFLDE